VVKHEKTCSENQHAFIPFAFDTFGFLAPDVVDLLQRVQKTCITMLSLLDLLMSLKKKTELHLSTRQKSKPTQSKKKGSIIHMHEIIFNKILYLILPLILRSWHHAG
jgi:hypothetical protein